MATLVSDNEPRAGGREKGEGIGQVGKEMTHADGWKVWGGCGMGWMGASNKSTFIYQRLKFQFFSNFLPFKCTRSAKWPGRRRGGGEEYPSPGHASRAYCLARTRAGGSV